MNGEKILKNCHTCYFLSKKPGMGAYFIYTCNKWGLVTKRVIPYATVKESIGKECPFYRIKDNLIKKDRQNKSDGLDIIV